MSRSLTAVLTVCTLLLTQATRIDISSCFSLQTTSLWCSSNKTHLHVFVYLTIFSIPWVACTCCTPVPPRGYYSASGPEEPSHPAQEDGEQTLHCWPPRASIQNAGANCTGTVEDEGSCCFNIQFFKIMDSQLLCMYMCFYPVGQADGGVVEAVMKMWPPPAGPKDRESEKDLALRGSSHVIPQSPTSSYEGNQPFNSSGRPADPSCPPRDHSQPSVQHKAPTVTTNIPQPSGKVRYTFLFFLQQLTPCRPIRINQIYIIGLFKYKVQFRSVCQHFRTTAQILFSLAVI